MMCAFLCAISVATSARATTIEITKITDTATPYATFQSHNQKIVQNQYGIFMTYLYSEAADAAHGTWRLVRSIDGGKSWGTLYRSFIPARAPVLETDEHGSIFVISPDLTSASTEGDATFYRFDPEQAFQVPAVTKAIVNGSGGKYTSYYDRGRKRLYYLNFWDCNGTCPKRNFYALDRNGDVIFNQGLTLSGTNSRLQYPHLEMDGSTLFFAWTTAYVNPLVARYPAILYVLSEDGGVTWKNASGAISVPFLGDHNGPGIRVSLGDEIIPETGPAVGNGTWLANFIFKGSYLHFAYEATQPDRQHYMRFLPGAGVRDLDRQPVWQGNNYTLRTPSGFFSSEPNATTPLFISGQHVDQAGTHIAVLQSTDLGVTWQDHAISSVVGSTVYALSGNRRLTKTGHILGHFTIDAAKDSAWFYKVAAVDRSTDSYKDWMFFPIDLSGAQSDTGFAYTVPLNIRHGGDTMQNGSYSKLRLFENGVEIGPAHTLHATIRSAGGGRFSHWGGSLYFSASNNSDPRGNNKKYELAIPWNEVSGPVFYGRIDPAAVAPELGFAFRVIRGFGTSGDTMSAPTISQLRLYEDGVLLGSPHTAHATIRSVGQGAYSHWGDSIYFSSSDNTDPRTNGRSYTWAIQGVTPCGTLHVEDAVPESGYAYTLHSDFGGLPHDSDTATASPVRLFENGVELGPAHSAHQNVRSIGRGAFNDWSVGSDSLLYFSSSDNSDPRSNGRVYSWGSTGACPQVPIE
jgi:catechol 2,3-dioxygenase-like lactoylglutathione lyase family enzyme